MTNQTALFIAMMTFAGLEWWVCGAVTGLMLLAVIARLKEPL